MGMKWLKLMFVCATAVVGAVSCVQTADADRPISGEGECRVAFRIDGTRVSYEATASGEVAVEWSDGDVICVATTDGTWGSTASTTKRFTYNAATGLFENSSATLPAGEYTFIAEYATSSQYSYFTAAQCTHKLPSSQSQSGTSLGHLSSNDCMVASTTATISSESANVPTFTMRHIYSLLRVKMHNASSKSVVAQSVTATFAGSTNVTGIYRITSFADGTIALNNGGYGNSVELSLSNCTIAAGATANAWLLIAPMKYSGNLSVYVATSSGASASRNGSLTAFNFERGKVHDVTVTIGEEAATTTSDYEYMSKATGWAELPAMPTSDSNLEYWTHEKLPSNNTLRNYSMCFDKSKYCALWVAYPLHSCYTTGSGSRTDEWGYDPCCVDNDYEPYLAKSYYDEGGNTNTHSRGHQLPSADRLASDEDNYTTFYYSNMTPQLQSLNGETWADLEGDVRNWRCSDTLYVVTGAHFEKGVTYDYAWDDRGHGKACPVPTHYWKVLLRTKSGTTGKHVNECLASELKCIGFWFDHAANAPRQTKSVAEIEALTGHTFFPNVPNAPKSTYNLSEW